MHSIRPCWGFPRRWVPGRTGGATTAPCVAVLQGATVCASDISDAMAGEAKRRYEAEVAKGAKAPSKAPTFEALDLESVSGSYHTVTCLDVMIHYPQVNWLLCYESVSFGLSAAMQG